MSISRSSTRHTARSAGGSFPDRYVEGICPHCGKPARGDECDQGCGKHLEPGEIKDPVCKVCGTKAEFRDQEHYFFKLSEFKDFLLPFLDQLQGTSNAKNYAIGWIKDELHDWCITRTLEWGVKFPGPRRSRGLCLGRRPDRLHRVHRGVGSKGPARTGRRYWCGDNRVTHFIGGDIIYHHCIFWPALLKGAGYGVPHAIVASGMVKVDDHKFSQVPGLRGLDKRRLSRQGPPCRLPPLLPARVHEPHQGTELLVEGLWRADQQRGGQYFRELRVPHALLCPEGVRRDPGRHGRSGDHSPRSRSALQT